MLARHDPSTTAFIGVAELLQLREEDHANIISSTPRPRPDGEEVFMGLDPVLARHLLGSNRSSRRRSSALAPTTQARRPRRATRETSRKI
ncbi:unnamed protein product [Amoebophrya sp. A25]|nr:unnamed protein product [Amoebophrya sp. A25]|eukprot:GSA25T00004852001.1